VPPVAGAARRLMDAAPQLARIQPPVAVAAAVAQAHQRLVHLQRQAVAEADKAAARQSSRTRMRRWDIRCSSSTKPANS